MRRGARAPDYPNDPEFQEAVLGHGVCSTAGPSGKGGQKIEDTGPLTRKRMETIDDEVTERALKFIDEAHKATSLSSYGTTPPPCISGRTAPRSTKARANGQGEYNDVMVAHDEHIGQMLNKLDELGIRRRHHRYVFPLTTAHTTTVGPTPGITPFRSEKNTNWGGRVGACRRLYVGRQV